VSLAVFFPASSEDPPFCFLKDGDDGDGGYYDADPGFADAAAVAATVANEALVPLAKGSLLLVLSTLKRAVTGQRSALWPPGPAPPWARRVTEVRSPISTGPLCHNTCVRSVMTMVVVVRSGRAVPAAVG